MHNLSEGYESSAAPRLRPLHCLSCRRESPEGSRVCPECGDTLIERGFCPVCEAPWLIPIGGTCPKHDVDLIEQPGDTAPIFGGTEVPSWVTVATFADAAVADAPRLRLEAEGIPTFLDGQRMGSLSMYQVATGGVKLQVPAPLVADARVLLSQSWSPVAVDDELDDAWDELAPEPGERRRVIMRAVVILVLASPLVLVLLGWVFSLFTRR